MAMDQGNICILDDSDRDNYLGITPAYGATFITQAEREAKRAAKAAPVPSNPQPLTHNATPMFSISPRTPEGYLKEGRLIEGLCAQEGMPAGPLSLTLYQDVAKNLLTVRLTLHDECGATHAWEYNVAMDITLSKPYALATSPTPFFGITRDAMEADSVRVKRNQA